MKKNLHQHLEDHSHTGIEMLLTKKKFITHTLRMCVGNYYFITISFTQILMFKLFIYIGVIQIIQFS